jgi:hypothetical protein
MMDREACIALREAPAIEVAIEVARTARSTHVRDAPEQAARYAASIDRAAADAAFP